MKPRRGDERPTIEIPVVTMARLVADDPERVLRLRQKTLTKKRKHEKTKGGGEA